MNRPWSISERLPGHWPIGGPWYIPRPQLYVRASGTANNHPTPTATASPRWSLIINPQPPQVSPLRMHRIYYQLSWPGRYPFLQTSISHHWLLLLLTFKIKRFRAALVISSHVSPLSPLFILLQTLHHFHNRITTFRLSFSWSYSMSCRTSHVDFFC